jgi:hypothetical protein
MISVVSLLQLLTPLRLTEIDAELNALRAMVENTIAFFYLGDSSTAI